MWHRIWDWPKNMLLLKNTQFLRNHNETWSNCGTHELLILTKFRNDFTKIVDFLIKAYFWVSLKFGVTYCRFAHIDGVWSETITEYINTFLRVRMISSLMWFNDEKNKSCQPEDYGHLFQNFCERSLAISFSRSLGSEVDWFDQPPKKKLVKQTQIKNHATYIFTGRFGLWPC